MSGDAGESAEANEDKGPHEADKDDGDWDVTGTFGPVKTITFTTDEGTWMNLDVHPDGERIVFGILDTNIFFVLRSCHHRLGI